MSRRSLSICIVFTALAALLCGAVAEAGLDLGAVWNGKPKKIGDPVGVVVFDVWEVCDGRMIPLYLPTPDGGEVRAGVMPAPRDAIIKARLRPFTRDRRLRWWEFRLNGVPLVKRDALNADYTTEQYRDKERMRPRWDTKKFGETPYTQTEMDPYVVEIPTARLAPTKHMVEFLTSSTNGVPGFAQGEFEISDRSISDFREAAKEYAREAKPRVTTSATLRKSLTKPVIPAGVVDLTTEVDERAVREAETPREFLRKEHPKQKPAKEFRASLIVSNGGKEGVLPFESTVPLCKGDLLVFKDGRETVATAKVLRVKADKVYTRVIDGVGEDLSDLTLYVRRPE